MSQSSSASCSAAAVSIAPGQPVTLVLHHASGSQERIQARHSYTPQQLSWFRAGSALNTLSK